jgi:uncharacterized protein YndB with AHSA1/START domain
MSRPDTGVRVDARSRAGVEAVWRCLADPYSFARWVAGTAAIRGADPQWPEAGARLYHRFGHWPLRSRDHTTVLDSQPPHRIRLAAAARPFALVEAEVTVVADGSGTRITLCERVVGGFGARFPGVTRAVQRRRNRRSLAQLVRLAEAGRCER